MLKYLLCTVLTLSETCRWRLFGEALDVDVDGECKDICKYDNRSITTRVV